MKLEICKEWFTFLGLKLNKTGWELSEKYFKSIVEATRPQKLTEIRSFLGLVNWKRNFIPQFSTLTNPLFDLQQSKALPIAPEHWTNDCETAFHTTKKAYSTASVFVTVLWCQWTQSKSRLNLASENQLLYPLNFSQSTLIALNNESVSFVWNIEHFRPFTFS